MSDDALHDDGIQLEPSTTRGGLKDAEKLAMLKVGFDVILCAIPGDAKILHFDTLNLTSLMPMFVPPSAGGFNLRPLVIGNRLIMQNVQLELEATRQSCATCVLDLNLLSDKLDDTGTEGQLSVAERHAKIKHWANFWDDQVKTLLQRSSEASAGLQYAIMKRSPDVAEKQKEVDTINGKLGSAVEKMEDFGNQMQKIDDGEDALPANTTDYEAEALKEDEIAKKEKEAESLSRKRDTFQVYEKTLVERDAYFKTVRQHNQKPRRAEALDPSSYMVILSKCMPSHGTAGTMARASCALIEKNGKMAVDWVNTAFQLWKEDPSRKFTYDGKVKGLEVMDQLKSFTSDDAFSKFRGFIKQLHTGEVLITFVTELVKFHLEFRAIYVDFDATISISPSPASLDNVNVTTPGAPLGGVAEDHEFGGAGAGGAEEEEEEEF